MSLHPSLRTDTAGTQQRSVLTRIERIKDLMKKGLWKEDSTVVGLPKTKITRLKTRKEKVKKEETPGAAPAAGAAGAGDKAAAGAAKPAAGAKPAAAAAKPADKAAKK